MNEVELKTITNLRKSSRIFDFQMPLIFDRHKDDPKRYALKLDQETLYSYDEKINQFEEYLTAYLFKAFAHLELGEYEEALELLNFVKDKQMPGYLLRNGAYFFIGLSQIGLEHFPEAIQDFKKFISSGSRNKMSPDAN